MNKISWIMALVATIVAILVMSYYANLQKIIESEWKQQTVETCKSFCESHNWTYETNKVTDMDANFSDYEQLQCDCTIRQPSCHLYGIIGEANSTLGTYCYNGLSETFYLHLVK